MKNIKILETRENNFIVEADWEIQPEGEKPFTQRVRVELPIEHLEAISKMETNVSH